MIRIAVRTLAASLVATGFCTAGWTWGGAMRGWTRKCEAQVGYSSIYMMAASKIMVMTAACITTPDQLADRKIEVAKGSSLEGIAQACFPNGTVISNDTRTQYPKH